MIEFEIDIIPVACGRPRFGKYKKVYTPPKTKKYKQDLAYLLMYHKSNLCSQTIADFYELPLALEVTFKMPIPINNRAGKNKIEEGTLHIKKPDTDNLIKALKDSMTGIFYKDDRQVCKETINKVYSYKPGITIKLKAC